MPLYNVESLCLPSKLTLLQSLNIPNSIALHKGDFKGSGKRPLESPVKDAWFLFVDFTLRAAWHTFNWDLMSKCSYPKSAMAKQRHRPFILKSQCVCVCILLHISSGDYSSQSPLLSSPLRFQISLLHQGQANAASVILLGLNHIL